MNARKKFALAISAIPLLALVSGCNDSVDLQAVRAFTAKASEASDRFPLIADDFYASCVRGADYVPIGQFSQSDIDAAVERVSKIPDEALRTQLQGQLQALKPNDASPFAYRDLRRQECEQYASLGRALNDRHQFLFTYLKTLGDLASDQLVDYSAAVDTLGGSVQQAAVTLGTKPADAEAQAGIFKFIATKIFTAIADNYRRDRLKEYLVGNSGAVDKYIQFLQPDVVAYLTALQSEDTLLSSYYRFSILSEYQARQRQLASVGSSQPGQPLRISSRGLTEPAMNMDRRLADAKAQLQRRTEAGKSYLTMLKILQAANVEFACKLADQPAQLEFVERCPKASPVVEANTKAAAKLPLDRTLQTLAVKYYLQLKPEIIRLNNFQE